MKVWNVVKWVAIVSRSRCGRGFADIQLFTEGSYVRNCKMHLLDQHKIINGTTNRCNFLICIKSRWYGRGHFTSLPTTSAKLLHISHRYSANVRFAFAMLPSINEKFRPQTNPVRFYSVKLLSEWKVVPVISIFVIKIIGISPHMYSLCHGKKGNSAEMNLELSKFALIRDLDFKCFGRLLVDSKMTRFRPRYILARWQG